LMKAIVTSVVKPAVTAETVRPRLVRGSQGSLLIVFNDTAEDQIAMVQLPTGYRQAIDLYSTQQRQVEGNAIRLAVPYQDVAVMRLE
jgi:hypothetical protein